MFQSPIVLTEKRQESVFLLFSDFTFRRKQLKFWKKVKASTFLAASTFETRFFLCLKELGVVCGSVSTLNCTGCELLSDLTLTVLPAIFPNLKIVVLFADHCESFISQLDNMTLTGVHQCTTTKPVVGCLWWLWKHCWHFSLRPAAQLFYLGKIAADQSELPRVQCPARIQGTKHKSSEVDW